MLRKFKKHLSYANVMASLAMFAVLGGGAFAAVKLKKDTVGAKQIKANAVRTAEIRDGAVTTPKLGEDAATGAKVDESTLGQVPSAANANSANTAQTAQNATSADNATNATQAADSTLFAGRSLTQVRPLADGAGTGVDVPLNSGSFSNTGLTENVGIPTGGATVIAMASVILRNDDIANATTAQCEVRDEAGIPLNTTPNPVTLQDTANGNTTEITLVGFNSYPTGTAALDPEDFTVFCQGSGNNNGDVDYDIGDLVLTRAPIGT